MKLNYICKHGHIVEGDNAIAQMRNGKLAYWACRECRRNMAARNNAKKKGVCKNGHPLLPDNLTTYYDKQRGRWRQQCKECHRIGARNFYRRGVSLVEDPYNRISFEQWAEKRRAVWEDRILVLTKSSIGNGVEKGYS